MSRILRIGTRDSQLAVWQATLVQDMLSEQGRKSELVYIKSEGDIDTVTPLYALGVQGVFTKALDAALLNNRIDIAVHSMKDVPTQLAVGIAQAAVLKRASTKDILVYKDSDDLSKIGFQNGKWLLAVMNEHPFTIGTSSVRRIAQWLNRYPHHQIENLRGNVNTRLRKLSESNWNGAIFAAAGLERINLRPGNAVDLDWMLPAPAQGAIMIACREDDKESFDACHAFNDPVTALCTKIERDFLSTLMGGCSTPISALAELEFAQIIFKGNICLPDGSEIKQVEKTANISDSHELGKIAAAEILETGGQAIVDQIRRKEIRHDGND
jgi:hydroxymethylbilane synthase